MQELRTSTNLFLHLSKRHPVYDPLLASTSKNRKNQKQAQFLIFSYVKQYNFNTYLRLLITKKIKRIWAERLACDFVSSAGLRCASRTNNFIYLFYCTRYVSFFPGLNFP